jgi:hypothetical protein
VILLLGFDRLPRKKVGRVHHRHDIFERDRTEHLPVLLLKRSNRKDLNLDHVIPRDRAARRRGKTSCAPASPATRARPTARRWRPGCGWSRKPKRPKWRPFVQVNFGAPMHDSWKHFLDLAYWNVELGEEVR